MNDLRVMLVFMFIVFATVIFLILVREWDTTLRAKEVLAERETKPM